jgi:hypothetical protein
MNDTTMTETTTPETPDMERVMDLMTQLTAAVRGLHERVKVLEEQANQHAMVINGHSGVIGHLKALVEAAAAAAGIGVKSAGTVN